MNTLAKLGEGDLDVTVSFARRNDEIGDLGRLSRELRAYRAHPHARSVARSLTREEGR